MNKLSAVVTVFNGGERFEKCLKSLSFVDELIVVDNESTDESASLARKYTDKVFSQKNNPDKIDLQKNLGIQKAGGDLILLLDADEEVSDELRREIQAIAGSKSPKDGYLIPRKNIIFGKWIENAGWYPDFKLILFKKGKASFTSKYVHEPIVLKGESGKLKGHVIHYNYDSVMQFILKTANYSKNEAGKIIESGYQFNYFDVVRFPLKEFLSRFFARKGYRDGLHGLVLSLLMAFYHLLIFCFIWEKQGFKEYNNQNFLGEVEVELKSSWKEIAFWLSSERVESVKNPLRKNSAKLWHKIKF